jgi:hypothetical protein
LVYIESPQFKIIEIVGGEEDKSKPAKVGLYDYPDGSQYLGEWNANGEREGKGHLVLCDGTRYDGTFLQGLFSGLGVLRFPDGAK